MQGFLEGDDELKTYEKKKHKSVAAVPVVPEVPEVVRPPEPEPEPLSEIPETDIQAPTALPESDEEVWQPASVDDMNADERAALGPLIKTVGDCNIYIENKK